MFPCFYLSLCPRDAVNPHLFHWVVLLSATCMDMVRCTIAPVARTLKWSHCWYLCPTSFLPRTAIPAYNSLPMPKIRDSGQKPDFFEVATVQTRRGKWIAHVPVKDSQPLPSPSRSVSPSKKRAWSPGVLQSDDYNHSATDQMPKRSRTIGKVSLNILVYSLSVYKQELSDSERVHARISGSTK